MQIHANVMTLLFLTVHYLFSDRTLVIVRVLLMSSFSILHMLNGYVEYIEYVK